MTETGYQTVISFPSFLFNQWGNDETKNKAYDMEYESGPNGINADPTPCASYGMQWKRSGTQGRKVHTGNNAAFTVDAKDREDDAMIIKRWSL